MIDINQEILDAWPFDFEMRNTQHIALQWLLDNIDKKYFIMQIPVGGGKSFIGLTLARLLDKRNKIGSSYIMTPQVMLQKQYLNDFSFAEHKVDTLYGKSRYNCNSKRTTCDIGSKIKKPKCATCPYKIAIQSVPQVKNLVINYTAALTHFVQETDVFDSTRTLLIADECHTLESQLTEFDSFTINADYCKKTLNLKWDKKQNDPYEIFKWINQHYLPAATQRCFDLELKVQEINDQRKTLSPDDIATIKECEDLKYKIGDISSIINQYKTDTIEESFEQFNANYILIANDLSKKFKARSGAGAFERILEPKVEKFLFMSSTIIDHESFCQDLGIDVEEAAFFDINSEFDIENRLIYRIPTTRMDRTWKNDNRQQDRDLMISTIDSILKLHKTESGIIHTTNFEIANWLVESLENKIPQRIYHHNDDRFPREKTIKAFLNNPKPSVLISPSSTEGLDLKGDLGRFAIFTKVPFPFLGDQWIRSKCEESQEWYVRQAILSMIQGSGRVIRSKDDYGSVYILDDLFDRLYRDWNGKFPKWWRDSVIKLNIEEFL